MSGDADIVLCMGIHPGYSGQQFIESTYDRVRRLRLALANTVHIQVDGGVGEENIERIRDCGATLLVAAIAIFGRDDIAGAYRAAGSFARVSLDAAIELARRAQHRAYPKPTVGAVVVRDGETVGEGATEAARAPRRDRRPPGGG